MAITLDGVLGAGCDRCLAPVAQPAEAGPLKGSQCGFKSHRGHKQQVRRYDVLSYSLSEGKLHPNCTRVARRQAPFTGLLHQSSTGPSYFPTGIWPDNDFETTPATFSMRATRLRCPSTTSICPAQVVYGTMSVSVVGFTLLLLVR